MYISLNQLDLPPWPKTRELTSIFDFPFYSSKYVAQIADKLIPETLYQRDDALLYIADVMLIWAAPIPADRWHCSLWT